jgi:hypothetical protein
LDKPSKIEDDEDSVLAEKAPHSTTVEEDAGLDPKSVQKKEDSAATLPTETSVDGKSKPEDGFKEKNA